MGALLAENIPQFVIQIIYAIYQFKFPSNVFLMSCTCSLLSIIAGILAYLMEKRSLSYTVVQYELQIMKTNGDNLLQCEIYKISQKKECKKALTKSLANALNIDFKLLECGKVIVLHKGIVIKMVHYLFNDDLLDQPAVAFIAYLYDSKQHEIDDALSTHFGFQGQFTVNSMNILQYNKIQSTSNNQRVKQIYTILNQKGIKPEEFAEFAAKFKQTKGIHDSTQNLEVQFTGFKRQNQYDYLSLKDLS
eukprot:423336_1